MFRMGGNTAQGILSGVAPRQGYSNGEIVNPRDLKVSDLGDLTIGQMQDLSKVRGGRSDLSQFLIDFGLDIASRPPSGSIFSTVAESAKGPYARVQESKAGRAATEADMFSTLFKGAAEAQGDAKAGKGWLEQWKFQQIPVLNEKIAGLEAKDTLTDQEKLELRSARMQLQRLENLDPVTEAWLKSKDAEYAILDMKTRLFEDDQAEGGAKKYKDKNDINLTLDSLDAIRRSLRKGSATGGRVGYQQGMSVMPAMQTQADTMPEELSGISYEELRARLPQEVDDQIVRLLANSAEALEDFAVIQTEQDIANFNKKYGVNLVLPAEG